MAKQYISAAVTPGGGLAADALSIDSSSAVTDLAFGQQTPTAAMQEGLNAAALFQAINALLSSNTRYTTINFYHQYYRGILGNNWLEQRELTINIVWSQAGVPGEISYGGFGVGGLSNHPSNARQGAVAGNMSFSGLSGNTNIDLFRVFPYGSTAYSPGKAFEINLDLTPGSPKINSLPFYGGGYSVSYTIETDDGVIVSAAAAPGDPTGIKISELTPTTSLNTTDLFVLSRDDPTGAPYDKSLNVTLADLRVGLVGPNTLSVQGTPTSNTGAEAIWGSCTLTLPAGKKWGHIKLVATSYNSSSSTLMPLDVKIGSAVQSWVNTGKDKPYSFHNSDDAAVITMINEGTPSVIDADITLDFYAKNMSDTVGFRTIYAIAEFY